MKQVLFGLILIVQTSVYSQAPNNGDCGNAVHISDGDSLPHNPTIYGWSNEFVSNTFSNPSSNPQGQNYGCLLGGEFQSNWCILTICSSGNLAFSLQNSLGGYLDWSLWRYDTTACFQIYSNALAPLACNWNISSEGFSGMANPSNYPGGAISGNFQNEIAVLAGEQYILCFNLVGTSGNTHFNSFGSAQLCGSQPNIPCLTFPIVDTLSINLATCIGACDAEVYLNALSSADSVIYTLGATSNYTGFFSNLCSGMYAVEIQDSLGCIQYGSLSVAEPSVSLPTIQSPTIYACDFYCDTITGSGLSDYVWLEGSNILSTQEWLTFCDSVPIEIALTGMDLQGCQADTVYLALNNLTYGIESLGLAASSDSVAFGGSSEICVVGGDPNLTYAWDNGSAGPCTIVFPIDSTTYCVTGTDPCGRTNVLCYTIYVEDDASVTELSAAELILIRTQTGFSINSTIGNTPKNCDLTLIDSFGHRVNSTKNYTLGTLIDTQKLAFGIYYVEIKASNFSSVVKYLKVIF